MHMNPFHLAIPVKNLQVCRQFYSETLGCSEGRSSEKWVDFNFFGHQLVIHEKADADEESDRITNPVDGKNVPVPHFGVVLLWDDFHSLAHSLKEKSISFVIEPYVRFEGEVGEQATMFFLDPEDNAIEFKSFKDIGQLFAK
ncbi:MAG: VOC family protein [Bacteroidota bacterium]